MPNVAMAQPGSFSSTLRNAFSAAEYQNECSIANAGCNSACTLASQELANSTLPSRPLPSSASWACTAPQRMDVAAATAAR